MLDSDAAGDQAAKQEVLIHTLGNKRILRTQDVFSGGVNGPEIEDLLRDTLIEIARATLGWDVGKTAATQPNWPIVDIFSNEIAEFSKYRLAKAYIRWTRESSASALKDVELKQWGDLIAKINLVLK